MVKARSFFVAILAGILSLGLVSSSPLFAQTANAPATSESNNPDFLAAVDEVLKDMSEITGWQLKGSLKKSIRSREQIRAYVLQQMNDEKDAKERYASAKTAEAFVRN